MYKLVGMLDSPYVRRVAVTLHWLGIEFQHRNWSVFSNADEVRRYSPLGRVPVLILDDGESLVDSSAILDFIDRSVNTQQAMTPTAGLDRRNELQRTAIALGGCDTAVAQIYEVDKRPPALRSQEWIDRRSDQLILCTNWLNTHLIDPRERLMQSHVTATILLRFMREYLPDDAVRVDAPRLASIADYCESLPAFQKADFPA